jgi:dipeptidyl aminopeptidase/acylaminoacyl peptidase
MEALMSAFLRGAALIPFLCLATPAIAQRGGQQPDSGGGRPALPLTPAKPLKFTTDEGTWLALDVSPDGRTIAFDLLGDIYTLPMAGGKATRITSGQSFDLHPHFSPDGKTIVFVSDRSGSDNLWLVNSDGTDLRQLTHETDRLYVSPTFTPDGKYVVASKSQSTSGSQLDLYLYYLDGGTGLRLTGDSAAGRGGIPAGGGRGNAAPNNFVGAAVTHFSSRTIGVASIWSDRRTSTLGTARASSWTARATRSGHGRSRCARAWALQARRSNHPW